MRKCLLLGLLLVIVALGWNGVAPADELRPFVRGSWADIRKSHAGRPTVVHFWGVTCGPCRVEMPVWGKLLQERPDLDLVVINADLVPNEPGAVRAMLAQTGVVRAENWTFGDGFVERLRYEIDPQVAGRHPPDFAARARWLDHRDRRRRRSADIRTWLDGQARSK
jgi:thiol-disulfide isomerase/thioredoxin